MDVVKLKERIMVVDMDIDKTLVVVKIIDKKGYRVNPQEENAQTDKKSENVRRGRGRARPLRSEVTTNQSSIQGSIRVSSALKRQECT
jgi:hypothetical protein